MESDEEFFFTFFTNLSQLCFDKAKEHIEKERERAIAEHQSGAWISLLCFCPQIIFVEKSYIEIGFLQNKNKGFLRKDNSIRSVYDSLKLDIKRLEESCKPYPQDKNIIQFCQNIGQFLSARIHLIDFYDKIHNSGSNKFINYTEHLSHIENIIELNAHGFTNITLTPIKAVFNIECEVLQQLFKALTELQRLQFQSSLALVHGADTRLIAWENKMQNRETWKLGFLKNNPLPLLYQWLVRFKGAVLSKFSLYFHNTLTSQTTVNDMRQLCTKLQFDYYHKIVSFQRKYDALSVFIISDKQTCCDMTDNDCFPVLVSCPSNTPSQYEHILKMIRDTATELLNNDKIIYKFSSQEQCTYVLSMVELNIYLILIFENKKSEKDVFISNFLVEFCSNLRCSKLYVSLKNATK